MAQPLLNDGRYCALKSRLAPIFKSEKARLDETGLSKKINSPVSILVVRSCSAMEICPTLKGMKTSKNKNDYAIWLVVSGIFVYIAADSGIFKKMSPLGEMFSFSKSDSTSSESTSEHLRNYAREIQGGLNAAEKQMAEEKNRIAEFQKSAKEIEKSIQDQRKVLALLSDEVESYRKTAQKAEAQSGRNVASVVNGKLTPEEASDILVRVTEVPGKIVKQNEKGREYLRLNTKLQYSEGNDTYLSNVGIRQADTFTRAAISMNMDTLVLAHTKNLGTDPATVSRIHGISSYIKEKFNNRVNIRAVQVSKNSLSDDRGLEIWAEKANE